MVRRVKTIHKFPLNTFYHLECRHNILVDERALHNMRGLNLKIGSNKTPLVLYVKCNDCDKAEELPNNVKEIWEKYWNGRQAPRF